MGVVLNQVWLKRVSYLTNKLNVQNTSGGFRGARGAVAPPLAISGSGCVVIKTH